MLPKCPYCQREMPESDIERAIQKEKEIWRPYDCDLPEYYTWTAGHIEPHWWLQGKVEITYA